MTGQTPRSRAYHANKAARIAAAKAEGKAIVDHEIEHFLYRCYDAEGQLLYIGCTRDVVARMMVHGSSWQNPASAYLNLYMDRYEVEEPAYVGRIAARRAERAAIEAEAPLLNLHHNKGRGLERVPAPPVTDEDRRAAGEAITRAMEAAFGDDFKWWSA